MQDRAKFKGCRSDTQGTGIRSRTFVPGAAGGVFSTGLQQKHNLQTGKLTVFFPLDLLQIYLQTQTGRCADRLETQHKQLAQNQART